MGMETISLKEGRDTNVVTFLLQEGNRELREGKSFTMLLLDHASETQRERETP